MPVKYIEINLIVEVEGTDEQVKALRDKLEEAAWSEVDINCGDPECCPNERLPGQPSCAMGSSRITDEWPDDEED